MVMTDQQNRIQELVRDLEEHTGVSKSSRPGIKTAKLMAANIVKQVTIKPQRERQPSTILIDHSSTDNTEKHVNFAEFEIPYEVPVAVPEISTVPNEQGIYKVLAESATVTPQSNPMNEYITLTENNSNKELDQPYLNKVDIQTSQPQSSNFTAYNTEHLQEPTSELVQLLKSEEKIKSTSLLDMLKEKQDSLLMQSLLAEPFSPMPVFKVEPTKVSEIIVKQSPRPSGRNARNNKDLEQELAQLTSLTELQEEQERSVQDYNYQDVQQQLKPAPGSVQSGQPTPLKRYLEKIRPVQE